MGAAKNKKTTKVKKANTEVERELFDGETAKASKANRSNYIDLVKKTLLAPDAKASMVVTHVEGSALPVATQYGFWGDRGLIEVVIRVDSATTPLRDFSKITKEEENKLCDQTHALFIRGNDRYQISMYINDVLIYRLSNAGDQGNPLEGIFLGKDVENRYI